MRSLSIGGRFAIGGLADAAAGVAQLHECGCTDERIAPVVTGADQKQDRVGAVAGEFTYPIGRCGTRPLHQSRLWCFGHRSGFDGAYACHAE